MSAVLDYKQDILQDVYPSAKGPINEKAAAISRLVPRVECSPDSTQGRTRVSLCTSRLWIRGN